MHLQLKAACSSTGLYPFRSLHPLRIHRLSINTTTIIAKTKRPPLPPLFGMILHRRDRMIPFVMFRADELSSSISRCAAPAGRGALGKGSIAALLYWVYFSVR